MNKNLKKRVLSLVVPLHNKEKFLEENLLSVRRQTFSGWEMIVVENGSADNGPSIAEDYANRDSRMLCFDASETVSGPGAARNYGLEKATGEWVLFLDADDFLEPDHLENLLIAAEKSCLADIVAGGWKEFETDLSAARTRWPTAFGQDASKLVEHSLAYAPWAVHAAIVRREWLVKNSLKWYEDLDGYPSEDSAFWFAVLQGAKVAWANSCGAVYRLDTVNSRNAVNHRAKWLVGLRGVVAKNLETLAAAGKKPSPGQIATLVRVYESRYREAVRGRDLQTAEGFRQEALQWLNKAPWWQPGMLARRMAGLRR